MSLYIFRMERIAAEYRAITLTRRAGLRFRESDHLLVCCWELCIARRKSGTLAHGVGHALLENHIGERDTLNPYLSNVSGSSEQM
jgi:hypothetical protein